MNPWIDPQGRRWTNIVPTGRRVVAAPFAHHVPAPPDLVPGRKARPISESMPEFFGDERRGTVVSIRGWRE